MGDQIDRDAPGSTVEIEVNCMDRQAGLAEIRHTKFLSSEIAAIILTAILKIGR
jgi:hypothetical protein